MTAQDIIARSLKHIGVLSQGETPTAEEAADCFTSLNQMIELWTLERLMIYVIAPDVYPLVANQQVYTLGPGGDWNAERPLAIEQANVVLPNPGPNGPTRLPVRVLTQIEWGSIMLQGTPSTWPDRLWYETTFPLGRVHVWPIPQFSSAAPSVELFTRKALAQFPDLFTDLSFPPGYTMALEYNLGILVAPMFGVTPSELVAGWAVESKARIKVQNAPLVDLRVDDALRNRNRPFNWLTGEPYTR